MYVPTPFLYRKFHLPTKMFRGTVRYEIHESFNFPFAQLKFQKLNWANDRNTFYHHTSTTIRQQTVYLISNFRRFILLSKYV